MAENAEPPNSGPGSMSVASGEYHNNTESAPRPNFPLPRELRDQIYRNLLRAEHVPEAPWYTSPKDPHEQSTKTHRATSAAHTYKFHVNIIATNHEISKEATKVLLSNNFIVVSHLWPDFESLKHNLSVPIVTENQTHVARFYRHVLRVHLQAPKGPLGRENAKLQSFLIVAKDLLRFCTFVRWLYHRVPSVAKFASRVDNGDLHYAYVSESEISSKSAPSIKIQFQDSNFTEHKPQVAVSLLHSFTQIQFGLQNVKILNAGNNMASYIRGLQQLMAPRTVWTNAMVCCVLGTLYCLKQDADKLLRMGDDKRAAVMYQNVWGTYGRCPHFFLEPPAYDSDACETISTLYILMLNSVITEGFITLAEGDANSQSCKVHLNTVSFIGHALTALPNPHVAAKVKSSMAMMTAIMGGAWLAAMHAFVFDRSEGNLESVIDQLEGVKAIISGVKSVDHDLKLVQETANDQKARAMYLSKSKTSAQDIVKRIAAAKIGPPIIDTLPKRFKHPDNILGLVDTTHLHQIKVANPDLAASLLDDAGGSTYTTSSDSKHD